MRRAAGLALYVALLAGIALVLLWYQGDFLPCRGERTSTLELEGTEVTLALRDASFTAAASDTVLWQSAKNIRVQDFLSFDIDRDGTAELVLLAWRRGNYGPSRPFWVARNDTGWSQHIFIYNWQDGAPVPQWMSSGLRPQVSCWAAQPDGQLYILTPQGEETLWRWGQWGLVRTDL